MDLHLTSCIIFILYFCILQTSQLPLKDNRLTSPVVNAVHSYEEQIKAFYYPSIHQQEMMKSSASTYYSSADGSDDDYEDYGTGTRAPSIENFESERIIKKPNDFKKINLSESNFEQEPVKSQLNTTQMPSSTATSTTTKDSENSSNESSNKFPKLLFSSPSATVTSNGPSGPFKAIICHDCENSGGVNAGHYSVSFSAIKSWNVGKSSKQNLTESLAASEEKSTETIDAIAVEQTSQRYVEINQNPPGVTKNEQAQNQGSDDEVTVNNSEMQSTPLNNKNEWNYSLLTVRNENVNPTPTASVISSSTSSNVVQKKPIFNDLLKVPYDVLNAPLNVDPPPPPPPSNAAIHINHQQKINDTITNYQHFQQFIQKSPQQKQPSYQTTQMPEQNYEVDEAVSLMTNGRAHGIQSTTPKLPNEKNFQPTIHAQLNVDGQDAKFGVVFEGRDFKKYKVEEKTADGFIVGEYGYLSEYGSPLFGVRYTADSNINPQLIYDALLKFIKL